MNSFLKKLVGTGLAAAIALNSGIAAFAETGEAQITEDAANAATGFQLEGYTFDENNTVTVNLDDISKFTYNDSNSSYYYEIKYTGGLPVSVNTDETIESSGIEFVDGYLQFWAWMNGEHSFKIEVDGEYYTVKYIVDLPMSIGWENSTEMNLELKKTTKEVDVWWEKAVSVESSDEKVATATIDAEYNVVDVKPVADGKATITVTGENGSKCTINATVSSTGVGTSTTLDYSDTFFTDSSATKPVEDDVYVYVNGGKDKTSGKNYKASTIYTKLENETVEIKGVEKKGKFATYVTLDEEETPKIEKGKVVVDKDKAKAAKNVASAKIKTDKTTGISALTVTAGKATGEAYVWLIDIKADKTAGDMVRIPVYVMGAPKTMLLYKCDSEEGITYDENGDYAAFDTKSALKTVYIPYGECQEFRLFTFLNVKGENFAFANDATYSITLSEEAKKYIEVDYSEEACDGYVYLSIFTKGRNTEKPTAPAKVKFDIVCKETGKKFSVTVNIVDNISWMSFSSDRLLLPDATKEKQSVVYCLHDMSEEFENSDAVKNETYYTIDTDVLINGGIEKYDGFVSTDKVKVFVTSNSEYSNYGDRVTINDWGSSDEFKAEITTQGYTLERNKGKDKFALNKDAKSAYISAKLEKNGNIIINAKNGTPDGEQAKLLYVVTHQDKTIDVYEAKISVGAVTPEISIRSEDVSDDVFVGRSAQFRVAGVYGAEGSELEISSSDESIFTVDCGADQLPEKANDIRFVNITGIKEGTAKLIAKYSGITKEYEITVKTAPVLEIEQQQVTSLGADKVAVGKSVTYKITASGLDGKQDYIYVRQISGWDYADYDYTDGVLTVTGTAVDADSGADSAAMFEVEYGYGVLNETIVVTVVE